MNKYAGYIAVLLVVAIAADFLMVEAAPQPHWIRLRRNSAEEAPRTPLQGFAGQEAPIRGGRAYHAEAPEVYSGLGGPLAAVVKRT